MSEMHIGFSLERRGLDLRFRHAILRDRRWLAPDYVRVRLGGPDLAGFESFGADDHMRLFFPAAPVDTIDELRTAPSREYTPVAWGEDWLEVEFAVHGDAGVAAPWAANAPIGAPIGVGGPRGSAVLTGTPGSWLLVGDQTAIPAIRRFAGQMSADSPGRIVIEIPATGHEIDIAAPVTVEWMPRGDAPAGSTLVALLDGLGAADRVGADPFVFIAAEQSIVRPGRALLERWGVDPAAAIVKGYWKRGEVEYHAPH